MKNYLYSKFIFVTVMAFALVVFFVAGAVAEELWFNGDFGTGSITPWRTYGIASVDSTLNSPFTNVYPNNGKALLIVKPDWSSSQWADALIPQVSSGLVKINFDFMFSTIYKFPDEFFAGQQFSVQKTGGTANVCTFCLGYTSFVAQYDGDPQQFVAPLAADTWFNLQMTLNLDTWKYSGTITQYGVNPPEDGQWSWTDRKLEGTSGPVDRLIKDDIASWAWGCKSYYDNFSVDATPDTWTSTSTIANALTLSDDAQVKFDGTVTAVFPDFIYIESSDRLKGIRVYNEYASGVGARALVSGKMATLENGERAVRPAVATMVPGIPIKPFCVTNKSVVGEAGLKTTGLLVRTTGKVASTSEATAFMLNDGSGVSLKAYLAPGLSLPAENSNVAVTGVSSSVKNTDGTIQSVIYVTNIDVVSE